VTWSTQELAQEATQELEALCHARPSLLQAPTQADLHEEERGRTPDAVKVGWVHTSDFKRRSDKLPQIRGNIPI
jgi:hypothetical protein